MTEIITAMDTVVGVVTSVYELITSNPLLMFFTAASIVPVGIQLFSSLKGAAK